VLDQRGANIALDLFVVDQRLGQLIDGALLPTGLNAALYAVYSQLAIREQTPGRLAGLLGIRPTTLSGYLSSMVTRDHDSAPWSPRRTRQTNLLRSRTSCQRLLYNSPGAPEARGPAS
jgi:hypothetical protein